MPQIQMRLSVDGQSSVWLVTFMAITQGIICRKEYHIMALGHSSVGHNPVTEFGTTMPDFQLYPKPGAVVINVGIYC